MYKLYYTKNINKIHKHSDIKNRTNNFCTRMFCNKNAFVMHAGTKLKYYFIIYKTCWLHEQNHFYIKIKNLPKKIKILKNILWEKACFTS